MMSVLEFIFWNKQLSMRMTLNDLGDTANSKKHVTGFGPHISKHCGQQNGNLM